MANWKEYTTKTTPEDADEIMIADTKANANKRTPFSGLWNWIAGKLATAVISQLETQNKSIIPALNELNSKVRVETNVADLNLDTSKYISSKVSLAVLIARTDTLNRPGYTGYVLCLFWIYGKWCTQISVPDSANNSLKIRSCSNDGTWSDWMNIK